MNSLWLILFVNTLVYVKTNLYPAGSIPYEDSKITTFVDVQQACDAKFNAAQHGIGSTLVVHTSTNTADQSYIVACDKDSSGKWYVYCNMLSGCP